MADSLVQLPADSTGKKLRTFSRSVASQTVEEQVVQRTPALAGAVSTFAYTTTSATILSASTTGDRMGVSISNQSNRTLYVRCEAAAASATAHTVAIAAGGYFEMPFNYVGEIRGIFASGGSGDAYVTAFTG